MILGSILRPIFFENSGLLGPIRVARLLLSRLVGNIGIMPPTATLIAPYYPQTYTLHSNEDPNKLRITLN